MNTNLIGHDMSVTGLIYSLFCVRDVVVQLDLKAEFFMPGKSCYERACTCLKNSPHLQADFIFSWNPCGTMACN